MAKQPEGWFKQAAYDLKTADTDIQEEESDIDIIVISKDFRSRLNQTCAAIFACSE